jgi:adenylyltransferase/sulfurtransferase
MFTGKEIERYSRHFLLNAVGEKGQEKLKQAKVVVIGAGGLGCPVLQYLAAAGVGTIGIIDNDCIETSNLQRQLLFTEEEVGLNKAEVAKKKLKAQNPHITLVAHPQRISSNNALHLLNEYDIVVDGSDNFPTRYLMNDACVLLNKPLVFGSIFKFEGQLSVFNYRGGGTYRCLFPNPPAEGEVPNCSEVGVLGVLPGILGSLMANEVLKIILTVGEVLSGKLFILDALTLSNSTLSFSKNNSAPPIHELIAYDRFCSNRNATASNQDLSAQELKQWRDKGMAFQLIDVRDKSEYLLFNIQGENIPLPSLQQNVDKIDRHKNVVLHCQSGMRSKKAIEVLEKQFGYTNLYNLQGGIDAWKKNIA